MKWFGYIAVAALATLLVGCGKGKFAGGGGGQAGQANILRYPLINTPTHLDPAMVQDGDTIDLIQNMFEGLTTWSEDNKPSPNLAERWDITEGGRTYVFHLKKGVKFHNGREMKADDVAFSLNRAVGKALNSETVGNYLNDIVGFQEVRSGAAQTMSGVKVIDDYTISITIDKPRPYFLGKLTYPTSWVVAKEAVKVDQPITSVAEMVGTGPFTAESYQTDQIFKQKAFKDYHNGAPLIDGIERPIYKDAISRYSAYKRGEIDILALQRQQVLDVNQSADLKAQLQYFARPSIYYVGLNPGMIKEFENPKVRQAIAMAINRDIIVDEILSGQNTRADGILPPGVLGHREKAAVYPYDVQQAQKLLAEAGYPGGKGFPSIKISFRAEQTDLQLVAESVAGQLKENLGINVGQEPMEWGAYLARNNQKKNPFFHMRWAADYLDPQNFISLFFTTNGNENKIYYSNPQVDALCEQADAEQDEAKRLQLYAQAEDIVLKDAPWVPIYFQRDAELIHPRVQGLRNSLFGHLPHFKVSLKTQ